LDEKSASGEPVGRLPPQGEQASLQGAGHPAPHFEQASLQDAYELLSARRYERVEQLLQEQQEAAQRSGQMAMVVLLAAACQLCLTCRQFHADRELHQLGYEEAARRERESRLQIRAVLTMLSQLTTLETEARARTTTDLPSTRTEIAGAAETVADKQPTLLRKIKQLLGFETTDPDNKPEASDVRGYEESKASSPVQVDTASALKYSAHELETLEEDAPSPPDDLPSAGAKQEPMLVVHCLGPFQVYMNNKPVERWPSGKGKSIFKYLVIKRERPVAKEVLMDLFWPEVDPDAARNNLNVAIYGLRQAFRDGDTDFSHVLYQDEHYLLNPELQVWLDVEEFMARFQSGQRLQHEGLVTEAVREYHAAEALYQGELLEEDRYEEWLMPLRRQLASSHLELLERLSQYYLDKEEYTSCITICRSMLSLDPCLEDSHCCLMRCHCRQGQRHLALRQYHQCVKVLKEDLEVEPGPRTEELYEKISHHKAI
jgi:DNA-binding SARP family transcriptional activator